MKRVLLFLAMVALASPALAQEADLAWDASPSAGVSGYRLYRAPCNGNIAAGVCDNTGVFAEIGTTGSAVLSFTDATVVTNQGFVWQATAFCPASGAPCVGESLPSNQVAHFFVPGAPDAPVNLRITAVRPQ